MASVIIIIIIIIKFTSLGTGGHTQEAEPVRGSVVTGHAGLVTIVSYCIVILLQDRRMSNVPMVAKYMYIQHS